MIALVQRMDHLPRVSHAAIPTLKIPCLDGDTKLASSGNFSDFPLENQWTFNELEWPVRSDGSKTSRQEISSFLQAWLFFEALRHVLKAVHVTFRKEDFIRQEDTGRFVTTRELPRVLREWKERDQLVDQDERLLCQEAVLKVLKRSHQMISGNLFRTDTPEALRPLDDSQRLAICVLHETLQHAYCEIWPTGNVEARQPSFLLPQSMLPRATMTCLGWCPSDVAQVYEIFDNTTLYFSSLLGRYDLGLDHSSCSAKQCLARHVDESSYKTRHRVDGCTCDYMTVDNGEVLPILRRGEIPRVVIEYVGEEYRLRVRNSGPYVAISHVWSDGLGNVKENSLPACQLKHIQEIAVACRPETISENTSSSIAIWIDTLCVPLEQEGRRLALMQLHEVYQKADRVLVLDGELQKATLQSDLEERVVRICVSGWMRRLWTLEEGVIGRPKLNFQFLEGSMPLPLLMSSLHYTVGFNALRFLGHYLPASLSGTPPGGWTAGLEPKDQYDRGAEVARLLLAVQYRTTSKIEDETICFAHLLKIGAGPLIKETTANGRMRAFLQQLGELRVPLPAHLVFTKEPKLKHSGFRWAPTSFTVIQQRDVPRLVSSLSSSPAYFDAMGLQYKFLAFLLDVANCDRLRKTIYFEDKKQTMWRMVELQPAELDRLKTIDTSSMLALLVTRDVLSDAALVTVRQGASDSEGQPRYYADWVCPAATMLIPGLRFEGPNRIFSFGGEDWHPAEYTVCKAKWIADNSWWHVA